MKQQGKYITEQEILDKLGLSGASRDSQSDLLDNFYAVVELRVLGSLSEIITAEQIDCLEQVEREGATKEDLLDWLGDNVADARDMIDVVARDYIEELSEKTSKLCDFDQIKI
ncbi:hypothetical protein EOM60_01955 [Candidatus Saccharibacteria bacterium]|nr:hypothetical protein [Candidatus Saccharibacteria bacterium]